MSQKTRRPRGNAAGKRCDSCGNPAYRKYNHSFLCFKCFSFDYNGIPRGKGGKVITNDNDISDEDDTDYGVYKLR